MASADRDKKTLTVRPGDILPVKWEAPIGDVGDPVEIVRMDGSSIPFATISAHDGDTTSMLVHGNSQLVTSEIAREIIESSRIKNAAKPGTCLCVDGDEPRMIVAASRRGLNITVRPAPTKNVEGHYRVVRPALTHEFRARVNAIHRSADGSAKIVLRPTEWPPKVTYSVDGRTAALPIPPLDWKDRLASTDLDFVFRIGDAVATWRGDPKWTLGVEALRATHAVVQQGRRRLPSASDCWRCSQRGLDVLLIPIVGSVVVCCHCGNSFHLKEGSPE